MPILDPKATKADTFDHFPRTLMSIGKTADTGTVSIFTKNGVTVHNETDVLITCKAEPIIISMHDNRGHHHIPLAKQGGQ